MKRWLALPLLALLLVAFTGCGGDSTQTVVFGDRVRVKVPVDMEPQGFHAVNAFAGRWTNEAMELTYDIGPQSDQLGYRDRNEFRVSILTIAGKDATIEYFHDSSSDGARPWVAALHIADIGNGDRFTMFIRSADEDGQDAARRIFRSIELVTGASQSSS